MKLVGLIGKARSGKDTAAYHMHLHHGYQRYAFAEPIKDMISAAFGYQIGESEGADKEQVIKWLGKSPRQLMQLLGTEWGRELINPNIWLLLAEQTLLHHQRRGHTGLVISDVRFDNEAKWIIEQGGSLIEITRGVASSVNEHVSESGVDIRLPRFMVANDGTLDELYEAIDEATQLLPA